MNLSELIHQVWKDERTREAGIRKDQVSLIFEVLSDHIVGAIISYGQVRLRNLFTIQTRLSEGRRIAHPQTGEPMESRDHYRINIRPSKRLKEGLIEKAEQKY